ncbi:MAG: amidohydrolase family protein [Acidimicrobiales bacterium]|nr:amidohydrolase family protein [Acidimicrobiales bacterium]
MNDLLIRGGLVVDGNGAPGRIADVAVHDGRIAAIGDGAAQAAPPGARRVDATGLVVAPGFVDVHTHYDAQVFWDAALTPSCFHGVTTVFAGNCGFSIAPCAPEHAGYLMRMLARVEGMPLESLEAGVPWGTWHSTAGYFAAVERSGMALNMGFMVGHSALRRAVLGEEASARAATAEEVAAMGALLADGLAAGGIGFSSSAAPTHNDGGGAPVPSRLAELDELLALARVVGAHPGTSLEMVPGQGTFEDNVTVLAALSAAADRILNWNVLQVNTAIMDLVEDRLARSEAALAQGGRLVPLTLPDALRTRLSFETGFLLDTLPGWKEAMHLPVDEKVALLSDPGERARLAALAASAPRAFLLRGINDWAAMRIGETVAPANERFRGCVVGELAAAEGREPFDVLCDIVVADRLQTGVYPPEAGADDESWKLRAELWRSGRALPGASDAGAHLDMISTWSFPTTLLAEAYRRRELVGLEEAVHYLTGAPAALYGLRDRGRLAPGWRADLVLFDPATVGPQPTQWRTDLPAGAGRLYAEADGVERVVVNGVDVVRGGTLTGHRPGELVRSGIDTDTVTAR